MRPLAIVSVLTLLCLAVPGARAAAGPAPAAAADPTALGGLKATLDPAGVTVGKVTAVFGAFELEIEGGEAWPIRDGSGGVHGFQFLGKGMWRLRIVDPAEQAVFEQNAKSWSNWAPKVTTSKNQVRDTFDRVTVFFGRPVYEEVWNPTTPQPAGAPDKARDALQKTLDWIDKTTHPVDHRLAQVALGRPDDQYVYALFDGGADRIGFEYDHVAFDVMHLFYFVKYAERQYEDDLSTQRIDPEPRAVPFTMTRGEFLIDTPDNRSGSIESSVTFSDVQPGTRVLSLRLLNNRDPRSQRWDSQVKALHVRRITDGNGKELRYSHRYEELLVDLGAPYEGRDPIVLKTTCDGDFFTPASGYNGDNYFQLYGVAWFPMPSSMAARRYTFTLELRTKKPFRPVSSGEIVSLEEQGDRFVLKARSDVPQWDIAVFAGKYKTYELKEKRWTVRTLAYAYSRDRELEALAKTAATFLAIYEQQYGPYPYKELNLVELPTLAYFGISPPGLVILTSRMYEPPAILSNYVSTMGANQMVAHEVAHQWFGHKLWPRRWEDNWLTESLAEYASGLAMAIVVKEAHLNEAKVLDFKQLLETWRGYAKFVEDKGTIAGANNLSGSDAGVNRMFLLYDRGPLVLHMLRSLCGEQRYYAMMNDLLARAKGGWIETKDFEEVASRALGQDMHWFFQQWIREPGTPIIHVKQKVEGTVLKVTLEQEQGRPFKKIHVPFLLEFADGRREVKLAFQQERKQTFEFPLNAAPTKVVVDPANNNLAVYQ